MQYIYDLTTSVLGVAGGAYLLLFREHFIAINILLLRKLHAATGLSLFEKQADEFDSIHLRIVTVMVGTIFLAAGSYRLAQLFIAQ